VSTLIFQCRCPSGCAVAGAIALCWESFAKPAQAGVTGLPHNAACSGTKQDSSPIANRLSKRLIERADRLGASIHGLAIIGGISVPGLTRPVMCGPGRIR
jgi:hypothetical protein